MQGSPATLDVPPPVAAVAARPPFTIGGVLGRTFSVWRRHAWPLALASVAIGAPSMALSLLHGPRASGASASLSWVDHAETLLGLALVLVEGGAFTVGALEALRGERPRAGALVVAGLRALPRLVVVALASWLLVALGALVLVVPAIVAATVLYVAGPAAVAEPELGALAGPLRRSAALTRGRRLRVFAIGLLALATFALLTPVALAVTRATGTAWYAASVGWWLLSIVPFGAVMTLPAVAYHDLRLEKEGASTDALAKVFD